MAIIYSLSKAAETGSHSLLLSPTNMCVCVCLLEGTAVFLLECVTTFLVIQPGNNKLDKALPLAGDHYKENIHQYTQNRLFFPSCPPFDSC